MKYSSSASFRIGGDDVKPSACSSGLRLTPDRSWAKDEIYHIKHTGCEARRITGLWRYESKRGLLPYDPVAQTREIMRVLHGKAEALEAIRRQGSVWMSLITRWGISHGTYCFDRQFIQEILDLGVDDVGLCFVGLLGEDEENDVYDKWRDIAYELVAAPERTTTKGIDFGVDYRQMLDRGVHVSAYLRISGRDVDPEACSSILGIDATYSSGNMGGVSFARGVRVRRREVGVWMFEMTSVRHRYAPERQVGAMVRALRGKKRALEKIRGMGDVTVTFGVKWSVSHGTYYLKRRTLEEILRLGVDRVAYSFVCCKAEVCDA